MFNNKLFTVTDNKIIPTNPSFPVVYPKELFYMFMTHLLSFTHFVNNYVSHLIEDAFLSHMYHNQQKLQQKKEIVG